ncbi:MAG TPA: DUF3575 domain-containing protein [Chitinophagaceae bacterium]|nr:DUF3575 domain-containing protein [Chitinophagaceae bacterium]
MRISKLAFLFVAAILISACSIGQTGIIGGKNIIKVNLSSIALNHYSLQYERVINNRQSFALGFGISPNVELPFKQTLLDQFGGNDDARRAIESTKFNKINITPEYRFYLGKKGAPTGFYLAPFARYTHMAIEQDYTYTPSSNVEHTAHLKGNFDGIGGGLMIGAQWMLSKKISLDWWIAGPFFGSMNAKFHGTDDMSDMSQQDKNNLESDIESVDIPLWTIDATVGNNVVDVKLNGPYYGIRAFGINLGYRF